jgi:hypothetical protein
VSIQIVSFRTLQKLKFICQIHDPIVGVPLEKQFEGILNSFNVSATLNLSIDGIWDQSIEDYQCNVLVIGPALSRCEAVDVTRNGEIKGWYIIDEII